MAALKAGEFRVDIEQLRPGVFIRLEGVPWYRHPFLTSSFRIKDFSQIETLKALGVKKVICLPDKSLVQPLEVKKKNTVGPHSVLPQFQNVPDEMYAEKKKRIEILKEKKKSVARAERQYSLSVQQIENLMHSINRGNSQFIGEAKQLSNDLAGHFLKDSEAIMHVLNLQNEKGDTIYYHSLNVTVLSLILGRSLDFEEDDMRNLALGAIFHDIGKSKIEKKILRKRDKRTKFEEVLLRKHPFFGVELLSKSDCFPVDSMCIVYEHHERCDGKGYPRSMERDQINKLAKVVSVANYYDTLINKHDHAASLTPYQALSYMYSKCGNRFEKEYLSAFIHCMGIYPPGTIIVLNNELLGMVVSVNLGKPLLPSVVLYDPQIPKKEALIIDLEQEPEYSITDSVNPSKLSPEIYDYLSPRTRITYFVDPDVDRKDPL